jgi:hypothetical protein
MARPHGYAAAERCIAKFDDQPPHVLRAVVLDQFDLAQIVDQRLEPVIEIGARLFRHDDVQFEPRNLVSLSGLIALPFAAST